MPSDASIPSDIIRLLKRWKEGDWEALASLASMAYEDQNAIAAGRLHWKRRGHTLEATGLVNELYLRA